jgi:purine-nucleoside phosphorylase
MNIATNIEALLGDAGIEGIDALVVLGSGMSGCFADGELLPLLDRGDSAIVGHSGRIGLLERRGARALVGLGRRHCYEGYAPEEIVELVVAAASLGARSLLLTNAAGGLNPRLRAGDIVLIDGCVTIMLGRSAALDRGGVPAGGNTARGREIFPPSVSEAIMAGAPERGLRLTRGVYAVVTGPSYETRAEIRMLRRLGGDVVGMSTWHEAVAGARLGMRVAGLSLITNVLTDADRVALDHGEVVEQGRAGAERMRIAIDAALDGLLAASSVELLGDPSGIMDRR